MTRRVHLKSGHRSGHSCAQKPFGKRCCHIRCGVRAARAGSADHLYPGRFSGGDEPDGSGKFITAFFRNPRIRESVDELLKQRDGLMCGVCNGFQALIKLGLIPYGEIRDADAQSPTLTYNVIGRHQSRIVRTRVCSNKSPWLMRTVPDEVYSVPVSHGEGRILCSDAQLWALAENGQIATQYVDLAGEPAMQVQFNPNGSVWAVEGLTSPDGRVFGKWGIPNVLARDCIRMWKAATTCKSLHLRRITLKFNLEEAI